jgi:uncharacterized protein YbcI
MTDIGARKDVRVAESERVDGSERPAVARISKAMVAIYKDQFGRGPTKVRTHWCGPDMIVCALEDSLTSAEKSLVEMGEHQRLRDMRIFFQYASMKDFIAPIEEITGRTVRSFVSGIDSEEDVSIETFLLYPEGHDGESRAERAPG